MSTGAFQLISTPTFDVDKPQKSRSGRMKRTYRCRHCSRTFKRSEHQARHERVHTQERPFACAYCDRKYARKDLVKRHERSLHAEAYRQAHPEEFGSVPSPKAHATTSDVGTPRSRRDAATMQPPGLNGRRPSILTPPTEEFPVDFNAQDDVHVAKTLADMSASGGLPMHQQFYPAVPVMQYSPPTSLLGLESNTLQEFGMDHHMHSRRHSYDNHYDYNHAVGNLMWQDMDGSGVTFEPPTKRRLIEVDPLLLLHDAGHPLPDQSAEVAQKDFPGVAFNEHYTASSDPNVTPLSFGDLSLEFLDFFEFGIFNASNRFTENQPIRVEQERTYAPPIFQFDEHIHQTICQDARQRLPAGDSMAALFPSVNDLNRFFSGYIECFHRHFPIIHLPSLEMLETPSPLIFAVCSIGAQYRLDRQKAKNLFALAGTMSSYALRAGLPISGGTPKPAALWIMQTRVLLSLGGIFSGKTSVILRTIENLGLFAIEYRVRKSLLSQPRHSHHSSWEEWVSRESSKRLLCGMFIVSNLISTTYGIPPGFETKDLEFEILDEETLWNARTAGEWHELKRSSMMPDQGGGTVRAAMTEIISNGQQSIHDQTTVRPDGLTMLLIMHGLNIHISDILRVIEISCDSTTQSALLDSACATLDNCAQIIRQSHSDTHISSPEIHAPLLFNCQALLQIAYTRIFSSTISLNRLILLSDNADDIAAAVRAYVSAPQQRNARVTKSVTKAYEGLQRSVRLGHLLLRKTAALSWSLEFAVAAWDATILLTKWIHAIETDISGLPPSTEETEILDGLKSLLTETETEYDGTGSLAAAVAVVSSQFFDDVWVWGVTPKMGHLLQQLAVGFEGRC